MIMTLQEGQSLNYLNAQKYLMSEEGLKLKGHYVLIICPQHKTLFSQPWFALWRIIFLYIGCFLYLTK